MARLPRVYIEGAVYYITCRGAFHEKLFREKKDYQMYIELLEKYRKEFGFKLFAYVLMPQHLHLLIEPNSSTEISDIMRSLNTAYSKYFNSAYNRHGHLFRERFKACIVEKESYLLKLIAHIHLNPLRIGLVSNPQEYLYSNVYLYTSQRELLEFAEVEEALQYLRGGDYSHYLEGSKEEEAPLYRRLHRGGILGTPAFIKKVKEKIESKKEESQEAIPGKKRIYLTAAVAVLLLGFLGTRYLLSLKEEGPKISKTSLPQASPLIQKITDLDSTEWDILCDPLSGTEGNSFTDTLTFLGGKFVSSRFVLEGVKPTNYSATQEEDKIVWETMQSAHDTSISWRGEIEESKMYGVISLRSPQGTQDFSFMSIKHRRKK
jgi:putative transposase